MALDTHAAVKTLTDAGADEALAVAVVEVAREASTEATGELVTRAHFDTALAQLESRLAWRLVTAGIAIAVLLVASLAVAQESVLGEAARSPHILILAAAGEAGYCTVSSDRPCGS